MKKIKMLLSFFLVGSFIVSADDYNYDDDIYYNPDEDSKSKEVIIVDSNSSEYINGRNIDEYNRFGGYYETSIDTIGDAIGRTDDFVYTQQIQKFYNPTIVVDNSELLEDVLENSYGNVEIVINNGYPSFCGLYSPFSVYCTYGLPYTSWSYWSNWAWHSLWYDPWYSWGAAWGWYDPFWGPTWYPTYRPHHPGHGHGHHYANYRPNGNRTHRVNHGWANNSRPHEFSASRGGQINRYGAGVSSNSHRGNSTAGYRVNGSGYRENGTSNHNFNNSGNNFNNHRQTTIVNGGGKSNTTRETYNKSGSSRSKNSGYNNYNNSNNSHRNNGSFNRSGNSRNSGNFGGGHRSGGSRGGGGRHR